MDNYCLTQLGNSSQGTNWMWCAKLLAVTCPKSTTPMLHFTSHCSHTNTQFASHHFCVSAVPLVSLWLFILATTWSTWLINTVRVAIDNSWFSWNAMILIMHSVTDWHVPWSCGFLRRSHWGQCWSPWPDHPELGAEGKRVGSFPTSRVHYIRTLLQCPSSNTDTQPMHVPITSYYTLHNSWGLLLHNLKDARVE